jgi:hypothetical protein
VVRVEGGFYAVNASGSDQSSSLGIVPYKGDELAEFEPLVINPVAVIDAQELPEFITSD